MKQLEVRLRERENSALTIRLKNMKKIKDWLVYKSKLIACLEAFVASFFQKRKIKHNFVQALFLKASFRKRIYNCLYLVHCNEWVADNHMSSITVKGDSNIILLVHSWLQPIIAKRLKPKEAWEARRLFFKKIQQRS